MHEVSHCQLQLDSSLHTAWSLESSSWGWDGLFPTLVLSREIEAMGEWMVQCLVSSREVTERQDICDPNQSDILSLDLYTGLVLSITNMFDHTAVHNCMWYQVKGQRSVM